MCVTGIAGGTKRVGERTLGMREDLRETASYFTTPILVLYPSNIETNLDAHLISEATPEGDQQKLQKVLRHERENAGKLNPA
jgi:hypothetical protein